MPFFTSDLLHQEKSWATTILFAVPMTGLVLSKTMIYAALSLLSSVLQNSQDYKSGQYYIGDSFSSHQKSWTLARTFSGKKNPLRKIFPREDFIQNRTERVLVSLISTDWNIKKCKIICLSLEFMYGNRNITTYSPYKRLLAGTSTKQWKISQWNKEVISPLFIY